MINSRLHFKISTSSFQTKLFCLCTRALRGNQLHRPFRARGNRGYFSPFSPRPPTPGVPNTPHRPLAFHSTSPPNLLRQLAPPPDPQQNPLRRRRAHPGRVPALRRQAYLHCRSQHAAARASPSSFARQPPSSISVRFRVLQTLERFELWGAHEEHSLPDSHAQRFHGLA